MKQKKRLTLVILFLITLGSFAQITTVQFTENTGNILNPERGFYKHTTTHNANGIDVGSPGNNYIPLTQAQLTGYRNGGSTLILRLFYIHEFAGVDHISQDYLNKMTADFQMMRANGIKAIIRFAYSNRSVDKDRNITLARIQNHLADVKPILEANKDVITVLQAGLIGAWGEWYYTNNFGDQGVITNQDWIKRYNVITALLQNVPSSIMVQLRSPQYKTRYLQYIGESTNALNSSEAYNIALAKARLGYHNDCFLSTPDNKVKTITIPKSLITNLSTTITVGYRALKNFVPVDKAQLPIPTNPMISYVLGSSTATNGVVDWENTPNLTFPFGFILSLKAADDANNIYIQVAESGYLDSNAYELFINKDNNTTTGWIDLSAWTSAGADILLQNGILYNYTGTNNVWGWTATATGTTILESVSDAWDDVGTYTNLGEIDYVTSDSQFLAVGGESCIPNNQNDCTNSVARMQAHHYTYINTDYHPDVVAKWDSLGCYSEMVKKLGYRLRLTESRIQSSVNAGKKLSISIDISNDGFAAPYKERALELVLTNTSNNQEYKIDLESSAADVRFWQSGNHTINESVTIPTSIPVGSYSLSLNLPDPSSAINTNPNFSIQFANQGTWNTTTGYNSLNTTINVLAASGTGTTTIVVDGNANDWQNVENLSLGSGNIQKLKSYDNTNNIYFIAQGTLGNGYALYIDADGNSFTGYGGIAIGAEYKIENGNFFRHEYGESWIQITATLEIVHNTSVTEFGIPKTALYGLAENVKFSYVDLQNGNPQATLPLAGLHEYSLNFPTNVPRPAITITADGNSADWIYLNALSNDDGQLKFLKVYDDATNLYLIVKGSIDNYQIYFNTDTNTITGLIDNAIWANMGADYVVLAGILYKHNPTTGAGANGFAWTNLGAVTSQIAADSGTHELTIPKVLFTSFPTNSTIDVGYRKLTNNVEIAKIPAVGGMALYHVGGGNTATVPSSPSNITAVATSSSQINLSWTDNSSNEDNFEIQRSLTGTNGWTIIATLNSNITTYSNIGLMEDTTHYYRVQARNTIGISNWSNSIAGTTLGTIPTVPTNLVAVATGTQIDVTWNDNASNESNYEVQRSLTGTSGWSTIATLNANSTSYSNTGLNANTAYYYRVRATNATGNSAWTSAASATTPQTVANAPSNLTANTISTSQIDLNWNDNATNEANFEIQQSLTGTNGWTTITTVNADITSYSNTGLSANTIYYYRVRATNTAGNSSWTVTASTTTQNNSSTTITVDGNASDWSSISTIATETSQNITSMKVYDNATHLFILLQGSSISSHTEIFLSADNNSSTGHQHEDWSTSGADYMIEDGELYKSNSNSSSWSWSFKGASGINYAKNTSVVEISILKTKITPSTTITIGAEDLNSSWNMVSNIPTTGSFVSYTLGNANGPTSPTAPSNLSTSVVSTSQIDLSWNDNATDEDNFEIQRSLTGTNGWTIIATVNANITSYSSTGLSTNTDYFYRVRANNTAGNSSWSNTVSATTQNGGGSTTITVDGNASDWSGISTIATENNQELTSLKVTDSPTHLYILLQGSGISENTEVFINADNNANTGHQHDEWSTSGADYMIENDELYKATGNSSSWDWQFEGTNDVEYVKNASVVEISVLKSSINLNSTITIGALDLDDNWDVASILPTSNIFAPYILSNTAKLNIVNQSNEGVGDYMVYPNPNRGNFDIKFGNGKVQSVTIYNMLGAKIYMKKYSNSPKVDQYSLSKLKSGLYKVLIKTNHAEVMKTLLIID